MVGGLNVSTRFLVWIGPALVPLPARSHDRFGTVDLGLLHLDEDRQHGGATAGLERLDRPKRWP